jgi:membrane dipeptidase
MTMKRREFLADSVRWGGAAALGLGAARAAGAQDVPSREGRLPLFFDGLSFPSPDLEDARRAGLSGFIWDVAKGEMIDGQYRRTLIPTLKSFAAACKLLRENETGWFLATTGSEIREARETGRTGVILQFQSTLPMADDLELIDAFHSLGLRVLQITHHYANPFGGGCLVPSSEWTGLTDLGVQAVEKMNEIGILPDVSHGNEKLCLDVVRVSKRPVIVSHTGCRAIVDHARCTPDSVIRAIAGSGGIVGIFAMSFWLTREKVPTVDSYVRQLEHVIRVGGIDSVGIANDFTIAGELGAAQVENDNARAVENYHPWWKAHMGKGILGFDELPGHVVIPELNDVRRFFTIREALEKKGYKEGDIEKILGGNWVRVLTETLG